MSAPVAFVCAMPMELAPLARRLSLRTERRGPVTVQAGRLADRPVVAVTTGMGTALATDGIDRLLSATEVDRVVVVGISGGIDDAVPLGTVVLPEVVVDGATGTEFRPHPLGPQPPAGVLWTSDELVTDPSVLVGLRRRGVVAMDMETAAVAAVCQRRGVAWSVVRVLSDRATDGHVDQKVLAMSRQDGTPDLRAVAAYVARHPRRLPGLARVARSARAATHRAAGTAVDAVAATG